MSDVALEGAFHGVFVDKDAVENQLIEFDRRQLATLATERPNELGRSLHRHFVESYKQIQAAYGQDRSFDFQHYNWGFTLCVDSNATIEHKLTALVTLYGSHIQSRLSFKEFEHVMKRHTDLRLIDTSRMKRIKWDDLAASFRLHAKRKLHYPDTISQKQLESIVIANGMNVVVDVDILMRRIMKIDKVGKKVLADLHEDPLLNGQTQSINLNI